jgi:hypothetical protein
MAVDATGEPVMIEGQRFVIVDLRIPFLRLVMFFIKKRDSPPFRLQSWLALR